MFGAFNGSLPSGEGENLTDNCVPTGTGDKVTDVDNNVVDGDVMLLASIVDDDDLTFSDKEVSTGCESELGVTLGMEDIKGDELSGVMTGSQDFTESKNELETLGFGVVGFVLEFLCLRN